MVEPLAPLRIVGVRSVEELHDDLPAGEVIVPPPHLAVVISGDLLDEHVALADRDHRDVVVGHQQLNTAHITCFAIGAAATPPTPPCSTSTAIAIFGFWAGANAMNQA